MLFISSHLVTVGYRKLATNCPTIKSTNTIDPTVLARERERERERNGGETKSSGNAAKPDSEPPKGISKPKTHEPSGVAIS